MSDQTITLTLRAIDVRQIVTCLSLVAMDDSVDDMVRTAARDLAAQLVADVGPDALLNASLQESAGG